MNRSILIDDARSRPDLFLWNGQMDTDAIRVWLGANQWLNSCPDDLVEFWQRTGGGDVFETETILGPLSDPEMGDDLIAVNHALRSRGMPMRFIVFHVGSLISAVDADSRDYVELETSNFEVLQRFASLNEWYERTLRKEYRERYNLS